MSARSAAELARECPSLARAFSPPWWLASGHLQTAYAAFARTPDPDPDAVRYSRTLLRVPDGGTLGLDWTPPEPDALPADTPIVVVTHGLTGGSHEAYVRCVLAVACRSVQHGGLGYRAVVVNFRGCAGVPLTSHRFYSAGTTEDLATALLYISQTFPHARLVGLGFSLGANVLTRYLAFEQEASLLASGCVLGCPWNLSKNTEHLEAGFISRNVYSKAMGRNLVAVISRHLDSLNRSGQSVVTPHLPILLEKKDVRLRDVDEHFISLIGGPSPPFPFPTAEDYYRWGSSHELVDKIRVPLLVIHAQDDPIVMELPTVVGVASQYINIVVTSGGGHLGWFEPSKRWFGSLERWFRQPVLEWIRLTAEDTALERPLSARTVEVIDDFTRDTARHHISYRLLSIGNDANAPDAQHANVIRGL